MALASLGGGKTRLVDDLAADDTNAAHEGYSVVIFADVVGGLMHEVSDRVVSQQQRPYFLADKFRCFRAEDSGV